MAGRTPIVMVSSTFRDLEAERDIVREAIRDHHMVERAMERPAASATLGILTKSFRMVDECDLYIVLVGRFYYGQIIKDPTDNPGNLSVTELEFERAQANGKDILVFQLHKDAKPNFSADDLAEMLKAKDRLDAFRDKTSHAKRIFQTFTDTADLRHKVGLSLTDWFKEWQRGQSDDSTPPPIPRPDACIGRDADIDAILAALTPGTAVLVHGPGGIGKTTIIHHAAHHPSIVARFPGRIWEAELETARDRDTFDAQVLKGLNLDPTQGFVAAVARLSQAPSLLVLDNLETAWEGDPASIESRIGKLAAIPGLALLASFRGNEPVRGASWTRLPIAPLDPADARALFLHHAGAAKADDPDLPALLSALGNVPLAICLLAIRAARPDTLARLWAEWQRLGPSAARLAVGDPNRLTSVVTSIEVSLASTRMTAPAQRLFALLGQCPAGLAEADRIALLGDDSLAAEEALLGLGLGHDRDGRLDLLPPVRDHARRAHKPQGDDATAWCRHFLARATNEGGKILADGGADSLAALTPEVPNIDAALRAAPTLGLREPAVAALGGVYRLLSASGAGSPAVLDDLAKACRTADDPGGEAACHYYRALTSFNRSDHDTARARYEEALPLYRRVGAVLGEANCIQSLGEIALRRSDHDSARARYEEALSLYRRVGDVLGEASCIERLGDIALRRSDHDGARPRYEEALPLYRRVGAVVGEANCIQSLGDIALARSEHDSARARYEEALPLFRRVGDVLGEANCIKSLGDIALRRSDHGGARARCEEALPLFRRVGDVLGEANCILGQGRVAEAQGDKAAAKACYAQALGLYERVHATQHIALAHTDLADVTEGAERAGHVAAAAAAWRSMGLEDQAIRVERRFSGQSGA